MSISIPRYFRKPILTTCVLLSCLIAGVGVSAQTGPTTIMDNFSYPYLEKLVQIAKESYPRVKSYDVRIESASVNVAKANINWIDILSFSFIYNPNYTFNILNPTYFQGIQVGVSVNMASLLQKPLNVRTAKLDRRVAQLDRDEYLITLENLVKNAYVNFLSAQQNAILQAIAFNNSKDRLAIAEGRLNKNEISNDVYVTTLNSYNAAVSAKISAEATLLNAKFALEQYLGGRKLEEIK